MIENDIVYLQLCCFEKCNSMIFEFWIELFEFVQCIDGQLLVCVIVILLMGLYFFVGFDILVFGVCFEEIDLEVICIQCLQNVLCFYDNVLCMQGLFNIFEICCILVFVVIQGGCIGGGVDFVIVCDMCYVMVDVFFIIQEMNIGMIVDVGIFLCIVKLIFEGVVKEFVYIGWCMLVVDVQVVGFVNCVYVD